MATPAKRKRTKALIMMFTSISKRSVRSYCKKSN